MKSNYTKLFTGSKLLIFIFMSLKLYCVNTAFKASLGDFLGGGDNLINTWKSTL
ncbi:hypothetical protein JUNP406_0222 [Acinetobacter baumannii]